MGEPKWQKLSPDQFYTLQEYLSYSSRKLKDVIEEFDKGGVLDSYNTEGPIDYVGVKLFMQNLLPCEIPEELCQDLFLSFVSSKDSQLDQGAVNGTDTLKSNQQSNVINAGTLTREGNGNGPGDGTLLKKKAEQCLGTATIRLKDLICYMTLLEATTAEEKLKFTFQLYDADDNGVLDRQEVENIISQMMTVAEYLGWDISELRPILTEMMQEIDYDKDGNVTIAEWMHGGLTNLPLLVLLGLDKDVQDDGSHVFKLKHFNKPSYCNSCHSLLIGLGKQGLCCKFCKYTVHERCASDAPKNCIATYTKSSKSKKGQVMRHHWVDGNSPGKCTRCRKSVKTYNGLAGLHCRWCKINVHNKCSSQVSPVCDLGEFKVHILPPTAIHPAVLERQLSSAMAISPLNNARSFSITPADATPQTQLQPLSSFRITAPPDSIPLLVYINPKSGGKQGTRLLRKFQYLLNPRQVFNLMQSGPMPGLRMFSQVEDFRILVAGGDGTVGWMLDAIDKMEFAKRPPVAILPLGTGNDLARCMGWGGGYDGENLGKVLKKIEASHTVMLDRWKIDFTKVETEEDGCDPIPCYLINNYFSIGVDASICHKFHQLREKHPEKFNSRMRNKLWYFEFGTSETFFASCKNLHEDIDIMCDGVHLDLANGPSMEGIAILNIPSIYGGTNLWGETSSGNSYQSSNKRASQRASRQLSPDSLGEIPPAAPVADLTHTIQSFGDGLIEVLGVTNSLQLGEIRTGLRASGRRLAQCSQVVIRTKKRFPMQIDGEPWIQPACTISITHKNQAPMTVAPQAEKRQSCIPS